MEFQLWPTAMTTVSSFHILDCRRVELVLKCITPLGFHAPAIKNVEIKISILCRRKLKLHEAKACGVSPISVGSG